MYNYPAPLPLGRKKILILLSKGFVIIRQHPARKILKCRRPNLQQTAKPPNIVAKALNGTPIRVNTKIISNTYNAVGKAKKEWLVMMNGSPAYSSGGGCVHR